MLRKVDGGIQNPLADGYEREKRIMAVGSGVPPFLCLTATPNWRYK